MLLTRALRGTLIAAAAAVVLAAAGAPAPVQPAYACNITVPANITVSAAAGQSSTVVNYPAPTTTGADCMTVVCSPPSGSTFPLGTTMVVCQASGDAGSRGAFTVTVVDTQPPAVGTFLGKSAATDPAKATATMSFTTPGASDNAPGVTLGCDRPFGGSPFAIGNTAVVCVAMDRAGNTATKGALFTVTDTEPPTILVPGRTDASTQSAAGTTVDYGTVPAVDNSGPIAAATCTPAAGSTFPVGTTTVSCTATDPSGNAKTATFPVVVTRLPDAALPPLIPSVPAVQLVAANPSRFSARKKSTLRYVVNTPARVAIAISRCTGTGRKPCSKLTSVRRLNSIGAAGLNSLALAGTDLKPASYRAAFTATDGFGRVSKPSTAGFTVTK